MKKTLKLLGIAFMAVAVACQSESKEEEKEMPAEEITLLVGTYTKRDSEGIYQYKFNPETGESKLVSVTGSIDDPSYLAVSPDKKFVYAVSEVNGGSIKAYSLGDSSLTFINSASSGGVHPCYVAVDNTGKYVFAGNYTSGSVGVLPVTENGGVGEPVQSIQHKGSGPNKARQEGPHVHSVNVSPNNKDVYVPDLGIDQIVAYRFDATKGLLSPGASVSVKPGSGPRHMAFHPNGKFAYLVQEMAGMVTAFAYADSSLTMIEEVSTLPEGYEGDNASADIHISPDGKFLYASNRFHDSIAVFTIDSETGKLSLVSHHSVMGQVPRNFAISPDGKYLLVANQESDNIVVFERDKETGKLAPTGKEIMVSMPVCLKFVD